MNKKNILLTLSLVIAFILIYSPHVNHKLPLHVDEWYHVGSAIEIDYLKNFNPIEIGFKVILTILSFFFNLLEIFKYLPAINMIIISLILFYYMEKHYDSWTAFASVLILLSIKTNVNLLGPWFLVPIIAVISLEYVLIFTTEEMIKEDKPKYLWFIAGLLFIIALFHQSSFLALSIVYVIYFSFRYKFILKYKKRLYPFLLLIIPIILAYLYFTNFKPISNSLIFLNRFTWGALTPQINFNPLTYFGIFASIMATIGFYITYKKKELLFFRIWSLLALTNIFMFWFTNFTIFSSYQRYIMQFMVSAVPLAGIGIINSIKLIQKYIKKNNWIVITLFVLIGLAMQFHNYYDIHQNARIYPTVSDDGYKNIQKLNDYPHKYFMNPNILGSAMYPITSIKSRYTALNPQRITKESNEFFNSNCSVKEDIINLRRTNYILSFVELNCTFLRSISEDPHIYAYMPAKFKEGKIDQAIKFDGELDAVRLNIEKEFNEFTIDFWVKPENKERTSQDILGYLRLSDIGHIRTHQNQLVVEQMIQKNRSYILKGIDLINNSWNHVTYSYDKKRIRLYQDGVKVSERNMTLNLIKNETQFIIGQRYGKVFDGMIDDFKFYNRSLSEEEIKLNYLAGELNMDTELTSGLIVHLKLNNNTKDSLGLNHPYWPGIVLD